MRARSDSGQASGEGTPTSWDSGHPEKKSKKALERHDDAWCWRQTRLPSPCGEVQGGSLEFVAGVHVGSRGDVLSERRQVTVARGAVKVHLRHTGIARPRRGATKVII